MSDYFFYSVVNDKITNPEVIEEFQEIREFGHQRYLNIKPESLKMHYNEGIEICFVSRGKYTWDIDNISYQLLPGDGFVTCPWEWHGSRKEIVDRGEIFWLILSPEFYDRKGIFRLADWSRLGKKELDAIGHSIAFKNTPVLSKAFSIKSLFSELYSELSNKSLGYRVRVYNILENLLIGTTRLLESQHLEAKEKVEWISAFEKMLSSEIEKKWSIHEMAAHFGMGVTSFNEKVKKLSGFTPSSFLINMRIDKAKSLLSDSNIKLTQIALECGFCSSQHFSSAFLNHTGLAPTKYRRQCHNSVLV
ncbi:MAG: AraC family transcriptional regulator [Bacteroidales bacterium]|nr:AraC family transcriptional regulator [Bacteroidales bacterium]